MLVLLMCLSLFQSICPFSDNFVPFITKNVPFSTNNVPFKSINHCVFGNDLHFIRDFSGSSMSKRMRRNCPLPGCKSRNLVKLSNHLAQVHNHTSDERKVWLRQAKHQPKLYFHHVAEKPKATATQLLTLKLL